MPRFRPPCYKIPPGQARFTPEKAYLCKRYRQALATSTAWRGYIHRLTRPEAQPKRATLYTHAGTPESANETTPKDMTTTTTERRRVTLRLPEGLLATLTAEARRANRSLNSYVVERLATPHRKEPQTLNAEELRFTRNMRTAMRELNDVLAGRAVARDAEQLLYELQDSDD